MTAEPVDMNDARGLALAALATFDALALERLNDPATPFLGRVCAGLDALVRAAAIDAEVFRDDAAVQARIATSLIGLAPLVASGVGNAFPAERVYLALAATRALFAGRADPLWIDRLMHAGMFRAELQAHVLRSEITKRGDPLRRHIAISRGLSAERDPHTLDH